MLALTIALVCLSAVEPRARAEIGIDSGATFYPNCWSYWAGQDEDSFGDAHKTGFCKGYVKAVTNALLFHGRDPVVCLPNEHVSMDEIHQTIRRYFENNPKILHENIDALIEMALSAAYPCGGTR